MYKSTGKLVYTPQSHLGSNDKWLVLMCDDEISKYYRSLFYKEYPWLGKLTRPVWGTHVSVIRGEKIPNDHLWKLKANELIEFEYEPGVEDNGEYYWLKVKCDALLEIRHKYGLTRQPRFGLHLTIGRTTQC
jgi:hypothetical protein